MTKTYGALPISTSWAALEVHFCHHLGGALVRFISLEAMRWELPTVSALNFFELTNLDILQ